MAWRQNGSRLGLLAPRAWASRCPRSRATLFPAAAARLLLAGVAAVGEGVVVPLSRPGPGGYFQPGRILLSPSLTRLREMVQSGSGFEVLSLVIFICFEENQPSEHALLWRRGGLG